MDKMDYPRGLIRYRHAERLAGHWTPRADAGAACCARACWSTAACCWRCASACWPAWRCARRSRSTWCATAAALARIVEGGQLENVYRLQMMNATEQPQRYRIAATGLDGLARGRRPEVEVGPAESRWVAGAPAGALRLAPRPARTPSSSTSRDAAGDAHVSEKSMFLVPRWRDKHERSPSTPASAAPWWTFRCVWMVIAGPRAGGGRRRRHGLARRAHARSGGGRRTTTAAASRSTRRWPRTAPRRCCRPCRGATMRRRRRLAQSRKRSRRIRQAMPTARKSWRSRGRPSSRPARCKGWCSRWWTRWN